MNHSGSDTYFSVHLVNLAVRKQYATIYLTFLIFLDKRMGFRFRFRFSKLKINLNFTTWLVRQPWQPNCLSVLSTSLTLWGRDKMVTIFLMPFSNAFSSMKLYEYHLRFHWSLFLRMNNIPSLVQIMAWWHIGNKPLSTPIMVSLLTHIWVTRLQWPIELFVLQQTNFNTDY